MDRNGTRSSSFCFERTTKVVYVTTPVAEVFQVGVLLTEDSVKSTTMFVLVNINGITSDVHKCKCRVRHCSTDVC